MNALNSRGCSFGLSFLLLACSGGYDAEHPDVGVVREPLLRPWQWPFPGTDAREWAINNYVDLDSSFGTRDYRGGAKTYDGHTGIDIDVPTFRQMDGNFPVRAVSSGVVSFVDEQWLDRHIGPGCEGPWNVVTIRDDDGHTIDYGHLKRNSVIVEVGQRVAAGQQLAVVGSSGCSTQPHLHLETHDVNGALVEPFQANYWAAPPAYSPALGLMDLIVSDEWLTDRTVIDPMPNVSSIEQGSKFSFGIHTGGGRSGDVLLAEIKRPNNSVYDNAVVDYGQDGRHSWFFWGNWLDDTLGSWRLDVSLNGSLVRSHPFQVVPRTTLFSDDFEDGNADGWTRHSGTWAVTTDDSRVYQESSTSGTTRVSAGSTSWANQIVSARVKPLAWNGSDRYVAVLARFRDTSNHYFAALRSSNRLELCRVTGGAVSVLASKTYPVNLSNWYDVKLKALGSALEFHVNGALELTAADAQFATGSVGLSTSSARASFDDVIVKSGTQVALPGVASNPSPVSAATGVSPDVVLSWAPGANATSHDVAFGTESTPPFVVNQTASSFDPPGSLLAGTRYFWRVSERNAAGTAQGPIWSFTTAGGIQPLFSDNFESGSLTSWSLLSGTWGIITDGSRVLQQSNLSNNARAALGSSTWTDQIVSVRVKPVSFNGSDRFVAVFARLQNADNYYYVTLRSSGKIELKKLVGGGATTLETKPFSVATGVWYRVRLEAVGTALRVYINDVLQLSKTDATYASGRAGVGTYFASAVFDDMVVSPRP